MLIDAGSRRRSTTKLLSQEPRETKRRRARPRLAAKQPRVLPSQRLLPCFFQIRQLCPDDPFTVRARDAQTRLLAGPAKGLSQTAIGEAVLKREGTLHCHLDDEARRRFREKQHGLRIVNPCRSNVRQ